MSIKLDKKMWVVEGFSGKHDLVVTPEDSKQTVFVSKCKDCMVTVSSKLNSITVNNVEQFGIVFEGVIATMGLINSKKCQVQCKTDECPSMTIDKSQGIQIFLTKGARDNVQMYTSLSQQVNVNTPGKTEEEDMKEYAVPEQFVTKWDGKAFQTGPSETVSV